MKIFKDHNTMIWVIIVIIPFILGFKYLNKIKENTQVEFWLTNANGSSKLEKQKNLNFITKILDTLPIIEICEEKQFQAIDGFGFSLTGGSAQVINSLIPKKKQELLQQLFSSNDNAISISYLRISIGSSDLDESVFSYNDLPKGQTDINLDHFSLAPDFEHLVPLLKEILAINPSIKIMGSPWSPPTWMKDNNNSIGGSLLPQYYNVYANYFVNYIQQMKKQDITIDAITIQNEPLHPGNNPSMLMTAEQQAEFIKNHLGPAFKSSKIDTKIIIYDHNCDKPEYPISILNDLVAKTYIDGSAFHLYAGDISTLSKVKEIHPDKNLYFTEQYTPSNGEFNTDLKWHTKNVIIGSMRNWSKTALEWNLANNEYFAPHTPGGCTTCKGALTIYNNETYSLNVGYYIIGHASKFVPSGSTRINSNLTANLSNVAFLTPSDKKVLIVLNEGNSEKKFYIKYNEKIISTKLSSGSVGTYIW
ncbi:MAG: glucosylceramidase [Flavobacteriaceae bacterium]|nr:glucosylceramidase [Flavobacteriaceae bacterium]